MYGDVLVSPGHAALTVKSGRNVHAAARLQRLWPGGRIPYTVADSISPGLKGRITDAVRNWIQNTPIRLIPRTSEADFVQFTTGGDLRVCASAVGRIGGAQEIRLPETCTTGDIIHEIGHAVGLWHQQERSDRNRYVTVLYENINRRYTANFSQLPADDQILGPYDFNSIMHYGAYDFSRDGSAPTIETVPAGIPIGQRVGLSAGDIAAVRHLYEIPSTVVTLSTTPSGLQLMVDGTRVIDGATFNWPAGSKHTVQALEQQFAGRVRYIFGSWSDAGGLTHEITVSPDAPVIIANYIRQRKLTITAIPTDAGTITAEPESPDGYYTERSVIQLSANAADGYSFLNWSAAPSTGANPKQILVNQPLDITAMFTAGSVTAIRSTPPGRTVMVDGIPITTPRNFAWGTGESHALSAVDSFSDSARYRFESWEDGDGRTRTVLVGAASQYTAVFSIEYPLTVYAQQSVEIAPSSQDTFYLQGTSVRLRAASGRAPSITWSGDLSGSLNPVVVTMQSEKMIWAAPNQFGAGTNATVVNAASLRESAIAPGQMITIYPPGSDALAFWLHLCRQTRRWIQMQLFGWMVSPLKSYSLYLRRLRRSCRPSSQAGRQLN